MSKLQPMLIKQEILNMFTSPALGTNYLVYPINTQVGAPNNHNGKNSIIYNRGISCDVTSTNGDCSSLLYSLHDLLITDYPDHRFNWKRISELGKIPPYILMSVLRVQFSLDFNAFAVINPLFEKAITNRIERLKVAIDLKDMGSLHAQGLHAEYLKAIAVEIIYVTETKSH